MKKFLHAIAAIYKTILIIIACLILSSMISEMFSSKTDLKSQEKNIILAAKNGNITKVETIVNTMQQKAEAEDIAIKTAARYGRYKLIKAIYKEKNSKAYHLNDTLVEAAKNGHIEIVEFLLKKGSDINYRSLDYEQKTPLMLSSFAGHEKVVKLLIKKGADLNITDGSDHNALFFAAIDGRENIVKLLIKKGANIHQKYADWKNILLLATYEEMNDVAEYLIDKNLDTNVQTGYMAAFANEKHYNKGDNFNHNEDNLSLFNAASTYGNAKLVQKILQKNPAININQKGDNDFTPLLNAAQAGKLGTVKLLISRGADINAVNKWKDNVLMCAASSGNLELLNFLIQKGFDVDYNYEKGSTPLMNAAEYSRKEAFNFLIDKGANYKYTTDRGKTVLFSAIEGECQECVSFLAKNGLNVNGIYDYETPLMVAVRRNNIQIARILLDNGADTTATSGYNNTNVFDKWGNDDERKEILNFIREYSPQS